MEKDPPPTWSAEQKAAGDRMREAWDEFFRAAPARKTDEPLSGHDARLLDVRTRHEAELMRYPNVVGIADGIRMRGGKPTGEPFYRRTLHPGETQEVQVYLRGGNDRVVTLEGSGGIRLRVIGGPGRDVVDDSKGGGTRFYAEDGGQLVAGKGSSLDRGHYTPPPPPKNAPWIPPRDWGHNTFWIPWLSYGADLGAFVGLGLDTQAFGFRKDPYASRHIVRAGGAIRLPTVM